MTGFWEKLEGPITALAPMENVTDTVFRRIIASCGCPSVFFTEFINVDWLTTRRRKGIMHRLQFTEAERPIVAQIWGSVPENYKAGAELIRELGFDGIDINMGCPAPKIRRKKACSGLINHPELASALIRATQEGAGDLPVSVKTRIGFDQRITESWTGFLLQHDLAALIVHARIAKEMSHFPADWDELRKVVAIRDEMDSSTLIIGNGDVTSLEEVDTKVAKYGVDGVMIGRGIFQDPYLFNPNKTLSQMNKQQRIEMMLKHTKLFAEEWTNVKDFNIMKKFFKIYIAGFDGALELRDILMQQQDDESVLQVIEEHGVL